MPEAHLRLILDAKSEKSARTVLGRLQKCIGGDVTSLEPYHKGGFVAQTRIALANGTWPEQVVAALSLAQSFGYGWEITCCIDEEVQIHATNKFSIAGLSSVSLTLKRQEGV